MQQAGVRWITRCALVVVVIAALTALVTGSDARDSSVAHFSGRVATSTRTGQKMAAWTAHRPAGRGAALAMRLASLTPGLRLHRPQSLPAPTRATAAGTSCGDTPGLVCSQVVVPLDRSGQTPGTISLKVETLPAVGVSRGVMFLIAGGPGQGSAGAFDLGNPDSAAFNRLIFPGYTLVAYDDRGTGDSGVLRCPALQNAVTTAAETALVPLCADILGPARAYYGTVDHAEDLEAVRQSLGVDRVGLFGVSYGTKLALAYALAHPDHVERLLLDSVLPTELPDPFFTNVLQELPSRLAGYCANGACKSATTDFAGDVVAVTNRLAEKPFSGPLLHANGKTTTVHMRADDLLSVLVDADLNPGLAATLPAVFHEARQGDLRPLLRVFALGSVASLESAEDLSTGLFAATTCHDGPFPWQANAAIGDRAAATKAALDALPAGSFGPFGSWAAHLGNADFCLQWPTPSGGVTFGPGPLPNVPMLAVSGGFDMRTPTASAASVAARFPQGLVLHVPGVGHSVVTADPSSCAPLAVRNWILGKPVSDCPRVKPYVEPVPALPPVRPTQTLQPETSLQTVATASATVHEAEAIWNMNFPAGGPGAVAGLYGGTLIASRNGFRLARYSIEPGVELTGTLRVTSSTPQLQFDGVVTVGGAAAARGVLGLVDDRLGGTLGGQIVSR